MKILVADDDRVMCEYLENIISRTGHEVLKAEDGEEAWRIIESEHPQMAIVDWMMPNVDGIELVRRIRSSDETSSIYTILLTSMGTQKDRMNGYEAGVDDYIVKPFDSPELFARIHIGERIVALQMDLEKRIRRVNESEENLEQANLELLQAYAELKSTQGQMVHSEKMASIGQLAAGIAHEINNPVGFIASNLTTLDKYIMRFCEFINLLSGTQRAETKEETGERRKKLKIDYIMEDARDLIQESLDGSDRVKRIVQNLKSFSRVDQDEYKHADINECIDTTVNIVWNELKYKIKLEKVYADLPLVKCYPRELGQVFMNLLMNASQAIEEKGTIYIKTWQADDAIMISIEDTGSGIPKDKLDRIFDPFFTTKEVGKGTGLGLSISYDIIKKHDGEITVKSTQGKGTTFFIHIPMKEPMF
ncbi:MAG: response regulator [Thermodesulfobacteriota bacterium]|nr:response regulator [Thermodesulfobacteriota bacterium]